MLVVRGRRIVLPEGERSASIHVDRGLIVRVGAHDETVDTTLLVDAGDLVVSPGIVDTPVHVNEPGRTEWEGFDTATCAAAAGGVTTLIDMPLNSVPATVTRDALDTKRAAAQGRCHVDVGFWGGVVPGNERSVEALVAGGVRGFKCFLVPSGVDEFGAVDEAQLRRALPELASAGAGAVPLLVHAELPSRLRLPGQPGLPSRLRLPEGDSHFYRTFLESRPPQAESEAIDLIAVLAAEF